MLKTRTQKHKNKAIHTLPSVQRLQKDAGGGDPLQSLSHALQPRRPRNMHEGKCKICNHPQREEIERILVHPSCTLEELCDRYCLDIFFIRDTIDQHLKYTNLRERAYAIADDFNYYLQWLLHRKGVSVQQWMTYNDQQQKREGKYQERKIGDVNVLNFVGKAIMSISDTKIVSDIIKDIPQLESAVSPTNTIDAEVVDEGAQKKLDK